MKKVQIGLSILMIIILSWALILTIHDTSKTSSPVEEMYHRQLVTTIDSILDARFGDGCCEENSNTDNANTFRNRFSKLICPMD